MNFRIQKKKVILKKQKGRPLIVFPRKDIDSKIDWKKSTSDIFNIVSGHRGNNPYMFLYVNNYNIIYKVFVPLNLGGHWDYVKNVLRELMPQSP